MRTLLHTATLAAILGLMAPVKAEDDRATGWQPGFTLAPYGWLVWTAPWVPAVTI